MDIEVNQSSHLLSRESFLLLYREEYVYKHIYLGRLG